MAVGAKVFNLFGDLSLNSGVFKKGIQHARTMAIANDAKLTNVAHVQHLPPEGHTRQLDQHRLCGRGHFSGVAIDPADPPQFESQAAHLDSHCLLTPAERKRLTEADFAPERVSAMAGRFDAEQPRILQKADATL